MTTTPRPFRGPYEVRWHPDDTDLLPHDKHPGWTIWEGSGAARKRIKRINKLCRAECEQIKLGLELVEMLPKLEHYIALQVAARLGSGTDFEGNELLARLRALREGSCV